MDIKKLAFGWTYKGFALSPCIHGLVTVFDDLYPGGALLTLCSVTYPLEVSVGGQVATVGFTAAASAISWNFLMMFSQDSCNEKQADSKTLSAFCSLCNTKY